MADGTAAQRKEGLTRVPARPPQQARSRRNLERLLAAGREVVAEQGFDGASLVDICDRAGVSVGAFYRRFESKEALVQAVHEQWTNDASALMAEAFEPNRWKATSLEEILARILRATMRLGRENADLTRASLQRAHTDPAVADREARLRAEMHEHMTTLLLRHVDEIRHPHPRLAVQFCAYQVSALFHYRLYAPVNLPGDDPFTDNQVVNELLDTLLSYLRIPRTAGRRRRAGGG